MAEYPMITLEVEPEVIGMVQLGEHWPVIAFCHLWHPCRDSLVSPIWRAAPKEFRLRRPSTPPRP